MSTQVGLSALANTAVTAGVYGGAQLARFTVDAQGRLTSAANVSSSTFFIDSSGNVGVGTTSPFAGNSLLTVATGITIADDGSPNPYLNFYNSGAGTDLKTWRIGTTTGGLLQIQTVNDAYTSATSRVVIDSSGNVGIGTTTPATFGRLSVAGQTTKTIGISVSSSGSVASPVETNLIGAYTAGGGYEAGIYSLNSYSSNFGNWLTFKTTDNAGTTAERMRIDNAGNVGIGTSSPSTYGKLAVEGINQVITARTGTANYCEIAVQSGSTDAVKGQFQAIEGTTNKVIIGSRTNHPLAFNVADTERMRIDTAGNITISKAARGTITTDNDLSFDMNVASNFTCTPTAGGTLTFTNITAGQSGFILFINNSNYVITAAATTKVGVSFLSTISTTGTYLISYFSNGTNVYCTTSGALS